MRSRLGSLIVLALTAAACGTQQPTAPAAPPGTRQAAPGGSFHAAAAVAPVWLYCGENEVCTWVYLDGACQTLAQRLQIPGQFADVHMYGVDSAGNPIQPVIGNNFLTSGGNDYFINLLEDGTTFDWSATRGVTFVAASTGAGDTNVYLYAPPSPGDTGLVAFDGLPLNQVLFCVDAAPEPALTVSISPSAGFTRTWSWHVEKSSPTSTVTAAVGATVDVSYVVSVSAAPVDASFAVTGIITIHNPASVDATGVVIAASLGGAPLAPSCEGFTGTIPAGATQLCTWSAALGAAVDSTVVVTVSWAGDDVSISSAAAGDVTATAIATFGAPTTVVDGCVTVTDDRAGSLGTVCAAAAPAVFRYTRPVGPYAACEPSVEGYAYANTATFAAPSGATGSATWSVQVRVPCVAAGCTLTQGYWKSHSQEGPAPYDARWRNVGLLQEDTVFFLSGQTWIQVFRTPVRGSAYYALAHQYMAAKLNVLAGASAGVLGDSLDVAEAFFAANTPETVLTRAQRAQLVALAALLDEFNNGTIGPGHCDEKSDCTDAGGQTCYERCVGQIPHDDARHQQCLDRKAAQGLAAQGVRAFCTEPDVDELCKEHDHQDDRIQVCVDECLWAWCVSTPPPDDGGCPDEKKHEECREHDRDDRSHGCGDHVKHDECRDHEQQHHHHD